MRFFKINSIIINLEDVSAITTGSATKTAKFYFHMRSGEKIISDDFKREEAEEILEQIMKMQK